MPSIVIKKSKPRPTQGAGIGMGINPMNFMGNGGPFSGLFGGGGASALGTSGASAGAGAGAGGSGLGGAASAMFSNPITAIAGAALAGASSLSADSAAAGTGANVENWLGPLYNIPEAISRGNWDDVFKDGAFGPIGAIYGIASGKDTLKSIMNSFGPLGQVPYLIGRGEMPFSGGKTSKNFMDAFQGRGV